MREHQFVSYLLLHINTALFLELYLISWFNPHSPLTCISSDSADTYGVRITRSSAYIRWLIVVVPITHPTLHLFNALVVWLGVTLNVTITFGYHIWALTHEYVPIEFPLNCHTNVPHICSQWGRQMQSGHAIGGALLLQHHWSGMPKSKMC